VRILLGNDDGFRAAGLRALHDALAEDHDVFVSAPFGDCSATSHGLTLRDPMRLHMDEWNGTTFHGLTGLPADAMKYGLAVLCKDQLPDLVISGINEGANTGQNLFYSGTFAAAAEGNFAGVPSIAISLASRIASDFRPSGEIIAEVVRRFEKNPFPANTLLNINVPEGPRNKMRGYRLSRMGHARFHELFTEREDPRGRPYLWMDGEKNGDDTDPEHDDYQVHGGWISINPCRLDLTHPEWSSLLKEWDLEQS
jgi:5'-nucleotidase